MEKIKPFTLIKYDYEGLPEEWRKHNPNPYKNMTFIYLGDIPNMPGHSYLQDIKTGKPHIFHPENILPLTEDET